ncbi:MAG: hypothetical protein ACR2OV_07205 [Hyphomicrobiaceae bacterium]
MRGGFLSALTGLGVIGLVLQAHLPAFLNDARAASSKNKAWPCIQRKVPELSAATIWTGPAVRKDDSVWAKNSTIAALVKATTSRRNTIEQAKAEIDSFAATLKDDTALRLTQLFSGQFAVINSERREIMAGIERYARRQQALSKAIKTSIGELNALTAKESPNDADRRRMGELNEKLKWNTRIFDEREQSLKYVCDVPVLLEQRLFALGRHIMTHLPK